MKVRELITLLQGCDPEHRVIIPGYEGGYDDIGGTRCKGIVLNFYTEYYYGPHDDAEYSDRDRDEVAILIFRAGRE